MDFLDIPPSLVREEVGDVLLRQFREVRLLFAAVLEQLVLLSCMLQQRRCRFPYPHVDSGHGRFPRSICGWPRTGQCARLCPRTSAGNRLGFATSCRLWRCFRASWRVYPVQDLQDRDIDGLESPQDLVRHLLGDGDFISRDSRGKPFQALARGLEHSRSGRIRDYLVGGDSFQTFGAPEDMLPRPRFCFLAHGMGTLRARVWGPLRERSAARIDVVTL